MPQNLKKGQILVVKVPPFFDQEYFYEVTAAGGKEVRVSLYKSPKVKKHWSVEEYGLLCEHGMVRPADKNDLERLRAQEEAKQNLIDAGDDGERICD
ncbi:MAG: hypothetical protein JSS86_19755 [Cyanobacteria bacterium SZAS LIN-2]|nr:hypothetical protein [Cyanobacteria bacterium SZAS LIN-3]MBS1998575.1 hypothetical protein [Cyanobacteria bacterium SZAS LIN-2]